MLVKTYIAVPFCPTVVCAPEQHLLLVFEDVDDVVSRFNQLVNKIEQKVDCE